VIARRVLNLTLYRLNTSGDVLIVAKRDRIARDSFLSVLIEREAAKKGARIVSAAGEGTETDDPAAIFTRRILDAVAELERALTAARTRAALRAKRARGERAGTEPYGFRVNGDGRTLHPHAAEQQMLTLMQECRAAGYPCAPSPTNLTAPATPRVLGRPGVSSTSGLPCGHATATPERRDYPFGVRRRRIAA
jgi:DNA invertase Pin-like site-specific DNA recombinase